MIRKIWFFCVSAVLCSSPLFASVNPDISVIGQVLTTRTDDAASADQDKTLLCLGESELVFEAALNPYARGTFVFSIDADALETEEAYVTIFRGLPVDALALKAGKYRMNFGKLNAAHPHTYPCIETPRALRALLPGEEGFNDTAIQASLLLPLPADGAVTVSADAIGGASFHPDDERAAGGWVGRAASSFDLRGGMPLEAGFSAAQGTNNIDWQTRTTIAGVDLKARLPLAAGRSITIQAEYLCSAADVVVDTATGVYNASWRSGFYACVNLILTPRLNCGLIYDQYAPPADSTLTDRAVKGFVGYTLMEETTVFKLACEKYYPDGGDTVTTYQLQLLFMMGPHKPHQF